MTNKLSQFEVTWNGATYIVYAKDLHDACYQVAENDAANATARPSNYKAGLGEHLDGAPIS